jgi:4-amino-4-deoxy-L-arabinose transferase-like glycosyltransferase
MIQLTRAIDSERAGLLAITILAAVLLLTGLDSPLLWQDEAQTALIAQTIVDRGLPYGTDGSNFFSQEQGAEYGESYLWRWHTWLPFYLVAASHAWLGADTAATRLPFALLGIATVLLTFATARRLWTDRRAAWLAAFGLALCVPFLLLTRQGRWYAAASFFSLLAIHAYSRLGDSRGAPWWTLFAAATLLFHSHYLYCATLLATLLVHATLFERAKLRAVLTASVLVTLVNAPWLVWLATISLNESYSGRLVDWSRSLLLARTFASHFFRDFFPPLLLLLPLAVVADRLRCGEEPFAMASRTRNSAALLAIFCAMNVVALGLLAPGAYFRYIAPLAPPALLGIGGLGAALFARSRWIGAAVVVAWLATSSLDDFAYELTHDFDGPIEGIVSHLEQHARPGDTVAMTYGDLPIKFYTDLRVIGGLTGEDLAEAAEAEWIIPRRSVGSREERRVKQLLTSQLSPKTHRRFVIDSPDTQFENRENPAMHRYRTERPTYPRVVIYGRRR